MGTKLEKKVKRELTINGVEASVAIAPEGFSFKVKGGKKEFTVSFEDIVNFVHGVAEAAGEKDEAKYLVKNFNLG